MKDRHSNHSIQYNNSNTCCLCDTTFVCGRSIRNKHESYCILQLKQPTKGLAVQVSCYGTKIIGPDGSREAIRFCTLLLNISYTNCRSLS